MPLREKPNKTVSKYYDGPMGKVANDDEVKDDYPKVNNASEAEKNRVRDELMEGVTEGEFVDVTETQDPYLGVKNEVPDKRKMADAVVEHLMQREDLEVKVLSPMGVDLLVTAYGVTGEEELPEGKIASIEEALNVITSRHIAGTIAKSPEEVTKIVGEDVRDIMIENVKALGHGDSNMADTALSNLFLRLYDCMKRREFAFDDVDELQKRMLNIEDTKGLDLTTDANIEEALNLLTTIQDRLNSYEGYTQEGIIKKDYKEEDLETITTIEYARLYIDLMSFPDVREFIKDNKTNVINNLKKWDRMGYKKLRGWVGDLIDDKYVVYTMLYNFGINKTKIQRVGTIEDQMANKEIPTQDITTESVINLVLAILSYKRIKLKAEEMGVTSDISKADFEYNDIHDLVKTQLGKKEYEELYTRSKAFLIAVSRTYKYKNAEKDRDVQRRLGYTLDILAKGLLPNKLDTVYTNIMEVTDELLSK